MPRPRLVPKWEDLGPKQIVAAVWVGNNDNQEMKHVSGIAGAERAVAEEIARVGRL